MNKKGVEAVWWIIASFIIVAIVILIVGFGFKGIFSKEKNLTESQLGGKCPGVCRDDCTENERFVLGLFNDCERGQICCAPRQG